MLLVLSCGNIFLQVFSDFRAQSSRYNLDCFLFHKYLSILDIGYMHQIFYEEVCDRDGIRWC